MLVLDTRELSLISHISASNCEYSVQQLDLGDIVIYIDNNLRYIYERKTLSDLQASIKDGRYVEQKGRLLQYKADNPGVTIVYIIEGHNKLNDIEMIYGSSTAGAIISLTHIYNFMTIFTANTEDTAAYITGIYGRILKNPEKFAANYAINSEILTANLITKRRKDNISKDNIINLILSQIPGISATRAGIVAHNHKSIAGLYTKFAELGSDIDSMIAYLSELKGADNSRRLGKSAATNIANTLFIV